MDINFISFVCALIGLIATFFSAYFFARPLLREREELEKMSTKYLQFGIDQKMLNRLTEDQKSGKSGFFLLSIGFFFQMLAIFLQMKF